MNTYSVTHYYQDEWGMTTHSTYVIQSEKSLEELQDMEEQVCEAVGIDYEDINGDGESVDIESIELVTV